MGKVYCRVAWREQRTAAPLEGHQFLLILPAILDASDFIEPLHVNVQSSVTALYPLGRDQPGIIERAAPSNGEPDSPAPCRVDDFALILWLDKSVSSNFV